jgi:hypothetical protein
MGTNRVIKSLLLCVSVIILCGLFACKKVQENDSAKIKPPVRSYVVTARIDKKGTNSNSMGTAVLHGEYSEETKILSYKLEYMDIIPQLITLRSGAKGTVGTLVKEIYLANVRSALSGTYTLSPLQERTLLKGQWFVAVYTLTMSPEISGVLTLKQK